MKGCDKMPLTERQQKEAELYAKGETVTNIAKIVGVSRPTIYDDMKRDGWKALVDEYTTEIKSSIENKLSNDVTLFYEELKKIALTSKSEKSRQECAIYLMNRCMGTPTNKVADVSDHKDNDNIDSNKLQNEFDKFKLKKVE
jgi:predicted DNA-binding protein YlxM (UPF0122 family)